MTAAVEVPAGSDKPRGSDLAMRATELAAGLRQLAGLVEEYPELVEHDGLPLAFTKILVAVHGEDARETVEEFARAATQHGAGVSHDIVSDETWSSISVSFGPAVGLWVFGRREQLVDEHPVDEPADECDGAAP